MIELATLTAHWPGNSINVCEKHAAALERVAAAMGFALFCSPVSPDAPAAPCINCVTEYRNGTKGKG